MDLTFLKNSGFSQPTAQDSLAQKMLEINLKQKEQETKSRALALNLPYINLKGFGISPNSLSLVSKEQANKLQAVVFLYTNNSFRLGTLNDSPTVRELLKQLEQKLHLRGELYLISENSLQYALALYDNLPQIKPVVRGVSIKESDLQKFNQNFADFSELNEQINSVAVNSLSEAVNLIVSGAIRARASDIHIEAEETLVKVRYRIDGVLTDVATLPKETWKKIISRLKLLAGLKINVNDRPQDGRFEIFLTGDKVDVRVSCLPTQFGESVVIRLLMSTVQGLQFEKLGLTGPAYNLLLQEIKKPSGMVISCGPTGSGKTTMLYAMLTKLNNPEYKIITIEDPIEYQLPGIAQSQVSASSGYTFAKGLRSIVRQDPDIVMVGEIRDTETAEIAIQASLTGHAVFSTLHTNDAAGAIPRLISLGAKPYLLAPALNAVIGQRLVRKICPHCKTETTLEAEVLERVKKALQNLPTELLPNFSWEQAKFYTGCGCEACQNIGYLDRTGIFEVLIVNEEIEKMILDAQTSDLSIKEAAQRQKMITMLQDGLLKALQGVTSIDEVFRVVSD